METSEYLSRLLPSEGWLCVAQLLPSGGFKHYWFDDFGPAAAQLHYLNQNGHNCFVAQASFKTQDNRKAVNAEAVSNCFLDIDCGPTKPYLTQREGADGLKSFCEKAKLPLPMVVSSGNGLYAHWLFDSDVPAGIWKNTASLLAQLVKLLEPKLDADGIIADTARVLRPVGVHNLKDKLNPKPVILVREAAPLNHQAFSNMLQEALRAAGQPVELKKVKAPQDEFSVVSDYGPKSDAEMVASKCQQINGLKASRGNLPEPLWYGLLNVVKYCESGHEIVHAWSQGYNGYSPEETQRKMEQSDLGPTSCDHIASLNPQGCVSCRFQGKIRSPIQLGKPEPKKLEVEDKDQFVPPPPNFRVGDDGVFQRVDETWERIYPYPIYISQLMRDHALGYEVMNIRHRDPHGEWFDIQIRSSLIHDPKQLLMTLHDQHLQAPYGEARKAFMGFLEIYMGEVRKAQKLTKTASQMGWCGESFVVGAEMLNKDGSVHQLTTSNITPPAIKAFHQKGELSPWVEATRHLDAPNMEPQAFALLSGVFGAPLLKFTGHSGAMVSMLGESGVGKTLMGTWITSAYGYHRDLVLLRDDTRNSLVHRLGVYGTLPAYIDEVSNMSGDELSDFVYRITQGRDRNRLTKASTERQGNNSWNTIAVVSTNHSLIEKLGQHKHNASAEMNRIFEYVVEQEFDSKLATSIYRTIDANYGHVGRTYAEYLVTHQDELQSQLDKVKMQIDELSGVKGDERFWSSIASTAILGGLIGKKLGLIEFDVARVMSWVIKTIKANQKVKTQNVFNGFDILGSFLDQFRGNSIVVASYNKQTHQCGCIRREPTGQLIYRIEDDTARCYISVQAMRAELAKRYLSPQKFKDSLNGALIGTTRVALGRGTVHASATQPCFEIDLRHPSIAYSSALRLLKSEPKEEVAI